MVRACEAALILMSLPTIGTKCNAQKITFQTFCKQLSQKLAFLCQDIPEDMDTGEIEDCNSTWGYDFCFKSSSFCLITFSSCHQIVTT